PQDYSGITEGSHTFQARAVDEVGNVDASPPSFTWQVDLTDPDTTITSHPAAVTRLTGATFGFSSSEAGSTFECKLDGAVFANCTSSQSYSGLADATHRFYVRATDPAGNL